MASSMNEVLEELGLTEAQLEAMMARARQSKVVIVEVEWGIYQKWEEIQHLVRTGELTNQAAEVVFETEVFPYLGLRIGQDYDPQTDIVQILPKRRVSSLST